MKTERTSLSVLGARQIVNQAPWDRRFRLAVGLILIYVGWISSPGGLLGAALRIFGPVPLVTGLLGWSPLYAILGISTKKK